MALAVASVHYVVSQHLRATRTSYLGDLAICLPLGVLIFLIASRIFGVDEIGIASDVFISPLRRSFLATRAKMRS